MRGRGPAALCDLGRPYRSTLTGEEAGLVDSSASSDACGVLRRAVEALSCPCRGPVELQECARHSSVHSWVMRKTLAETGTSVRVALEMLGRIRAGGVQIGRKTVPFLTNVGRNARECYARLGVKVPNVSDVSDIATATL